MKELNLNELLLSMSYVLDFVEMDVLGVASNHSKRVAYISLAMAREIGLSREECFDIVALAVLHDNGLTEKALRDGEKLEPTTKRKFLERFKDHCVIGENNIKDFPFLTDVTDVIRYHHEHYDGTGFFKLKGDEIPIMSQIISFADNLDTEFNLKDGYRYKEEEILKYLKAKENKWSSTKVLNSFIDVAKFTGFSLDLKDPLIGKAINRHLDRFNRNLSYEEIRKISQVFSKIIDSKSKFTADHSQGLCKKVEIISKYYEKNREETIKLMIAADLHDIGKLIIANTILEKPSSLTDEEFKIMKTHTYYTRLCLESLNGFEDITEWASNHHEKLDGSGYPYGFDRNRLDFNSKMMGCLDIYQALIEDRPYRKGMGHEKTMKILRDMARQGLIDREIVEDIDYVFK